MNKQALSSMQHDMKIFKYAGEKQGNFIGRVIYSALCEWMRYTILDETTQNHDRKSKSYIMIRMKELLINMIESFPESRYWFCTGEDMQIDADDLIHRLRDKMLASGELIEVDSSRNMGLPNENRSICADGYERIVGLVNCRQLLEYVGVTKILKSDKLLNIAVNCSLNIDSFLEWIIKNAIWNESINLENYEFFNPYIKRPPYQSWTSNPPKDELITLARVNLFNGLHEYYLVKRQTGKMHIAPIMRTLEEWKEERRILLALRKKVENSIWADYTDKKDIVLLNLYCGIPLREQVLLDTYCWPLNSMEDKYNYVVPKAVWKIVKDNLINGLGINLRERTS